MTTQELIAELWDRVPSVRRKDVAEIIEAYASEVQRRVLENEAVYLPGVGKFYLITKKPRNFFNMTTRKMDYDAGGQKLIRFRMFPSVVK